MKVQNSKGSYNTGKIDTKKEALRRVKQYKHENVDLKEITTIEKSVAQYDTNVQWKSKSNPYGEGYFVVAGLENIKPAWWVSKDGEVLLANYPARQITFNLDATGFTVSEKMLNNLFNYSYIQNFRVDQEVSSSSNESTTSTTAVDDDTCTPAIKDGMCGEVVEAAKSEISMAGYQCSTVETIQPFMMSDGYTVYCDNHEYTYYLKDKGGNWVVELAE